MLGLLMNFGVRTVLSAANLIFLVQNEIFERLFLAIL